MACLHEYQELFKCADVPGRIQKRAMAGGMRTSLVRSLSWRVFLGVFPHGAYTTREWLDSQEAKRKEYDRHCEEFLVDPYKGKEGEDPLLNNPLAQSENSTWTKYFELRELQKDIQIDLERLNPDDEFYRSDTVQTSMMRVLTVWASLNTAISYRQGMHELLAPIVKEQKLDKWGKQRLTELLAPKKASSEEIEFKGTRMAFTFTVRASSMEGDAWTHIRKGKSVVGYNFEAAVTLAGKVKTSSREESVSAEIEMDLMVDNEPDVNINITEGNNLPFVSLINKAILNHVKSSIAQFIADLAAKAEGQKNKVESDAPSPAPSPVAASKANADSTGAAGQESVAKSHFGGRVQVGGHQAGGLRIS